MGPFVRSQHKTGISLQSLDTRGQNLTQSIVCRVKTVQRNDYIEAFYLLKEDLSNLEEPQDNHKVPVS